jgi:cyclopropane-fatty-acyl-phospholipid synthase
MLTREKSASLIDGKREAPEAVAPRDFWSRALLRGLQGITHGRLTLLTPDNAVHKFGDPNGELQATIALRHKRLARRLLLGGSVGFAEAYMDGDCDSPDLVALIRLALANDRSMGVADDEGVLTHRLIDRLRHLLNPNTRRGSRRNIAYHYDLGNEFYARWLDRGMTYSSAIFDERTETLEAAQDAKYRKVIEFLELEPGQNLLEIGCGWGGFAELAAGQHGCRVTGLTLSRQQHQFATERLAAAGLGERTEIRLQDYRDVTGAFDRIASIEMLEAVGEVHWPIYFSRLRERLKPGGIAVLQVITIADHRFAAYRRSADFIQRYIFPGGMLPSPTVMREMSAQAGLRLVEGPRFADSYARTLGLWQERFQSSWPAIAALGFDRRFKRMWEYYLAYCEAGFRTGALDVGIYRLERA